MYGVFGVVDGWRVERDVEGSGVGGHVVVAVMPGTGTGRWRGVLRFDCGRMAVGFFCDWERLRGLSVVLYRKMEFFLVRRGRGKLWGL